MLDATEYGLAQQQMSVNSYTEAPKRDHRPHHRHSAGRAPTAAPGGAPAAAHADRRARPLQWPVAVRAQLPAPDERDGARVTNKRDAGSRTATYTTG